VWRGETAWFVAKGFERPATHGEVEDLRNFASDLAHCLESGSIPA
jgi:hypothetical protein